MNPPSNSTDRSRLVARWLGFGLIGLFFYAMLSAVLLLISFVLLQRGIAPDLPWVSAIQKNLYMKATRSIWQRQGSCVDYDDQLIYKPKEGACKFENVEFSTILNFAADGRYTGSKPKGRGIAVLGDSHAMGWGVADEETFAAELQQLSNRPIYNLAVSSYGTVRELLRLEKTGLLDQIDTIVIQYCENDLEENLQGRTGDAIDNKKKFETITKETSGLTNLLRMLRRAYGYAFSWPFKTIRSRPDAKRPLDFSPHYEPLLSVLGKNPALADKRILVFYSNGHGQAFLKYPVGRDKHLSNLEFVDIDFQRGDYYRLDDHLTPAGHKKTAQYLWQVLQEKQP